VAYVIFIIIVYSNIYIYIYIYNIIYREYNLLNIFIVIVYSYIYSMYILDHCLNNSNNFNIRTLTKFIVLIIMDMDRSLK
jgi:hypothetical protein